MYIDFVEIRNLRNLTHVKTQLGQKFNFLYGINGSGKTSFLEAIHYLILGRSFRTRLNTRLVNQDVDCFQIFGQLQKDSQTLAVGIERYTNGEGCIRINQEDAKSTLEITKQLPIRLLYTDSRLLLSGAKKMRSQFIDWGVFHVEHQFLKHWQYAQRALKQRNAAIRSHVGRNMVKLWENELAHQSQQINIFRKTYVKAFSAIFMATICQLLPDINISIHYKPGWDEEMGLLSVWEQNWKRDVELGYTQHGHHRADLVMRVNKTIPAQEILSLGQQKLLVYGLYLAQGILLKQQANKKSLYLLDDLPAELDVKNRERVLMLLNDIDAQVIITGINKMQCSWLQDTCQIKMFHVEHGNITEVQ